MNPTLVKMALMNSAFRSLSGTAAPRINNAFHVLKGPAGKAVVQRGRAPLPALAKRPAAAAAPTAGRMLPMQLLKLISELGGAKRASFELVPRNQAHLADNARAIGPRMPQMGFGDAVSSVARPAAAGLLNGVAGRGARGILPKLGLYASRFMRRNPLLSAGLAATGLAGAGALGGHIGYGSGNTAGRQQGYQAAGNQFANANFMDRLMYMFGGQNAYPMLGLPKAATAVNTAKWPRRGKAPVGMPVDPTEHKPSGGLIKWPTNSPAPIPTDSSSSEKQAGKLLASAALTGARALGRGFAGTIGRSWGRLGRSALRWGGGKVLPAGERAAGSFLDRATTGANSLANWGKRYGTTGPAAGVSGGRIAGVGRFLGDALTPMGVGTGALMGFSSAGANMDGQMDAATQLAQRYKDMPFFDRMMMGINPDLMVQQMPAAVRQNIR